MKKLVSFLDPIKTPGFDGQVEYKNVRWWQGNVRFDTTHFITDDETVRQAHLAKGVIDYGEEVKRLQVTEKTDEKAEEVESQDSSLPSKEEKDLELPDFDNMKADDVKAYAEQLTGKEYRTKKEAVEAIENHVR